MAERKSGKSGRGFASMDEDKQREIASKGGRAAHQKGTAHEFTPEEARVAGKKGGEAVSRDRAHMVEIGREGGQTSHAHRTGAETAAASPVAAPVANAPGSPGLGTNQEQATMARFMHETNAESAFSGGGP